MKLFGRILACLGLVVLLGMAVTSTAGAAPSDHRPSDGSVGNADDKNPPGQSNGDKNHGYECDDNNGVGHGNPAHTRDCDEQGNPTTTTVVNNTQPTTTVTTAPVDTTTVVTVPDTVVPNETPVVTEAPVLAETPVMLATTGKTTDVLLLLGVGLVLGGIAFLLVGKRA
jgi:hypothetical protein